MLIPIAVILFMIWIVRILFGVKIDVPKGMPKKISGKLPGHKPVYTELREKES